MNRYKDEAWLREQYASRRRGAPDIAEECNVDTKTIYNWLDRFGISTRSRSKATQIAWEDDDYAERMSETRQGESNHMYGRTGADNPNYEGGYDGDWRAGKRWQRVRGLVYKRANNKCESCGEHGELHAHHITPVSEGGAKYDLDNLVCLCRGCHMKVHGGGD